MTSDGPASGSGLSTRLRTLAGSRLVRQNMVLFAGGLVAGLGGFLYHAIATRILGPAAYGEVATLVALYAVGGAANLILILVLARYAATLQASGNTSGLRYLIVRSNQVLALPAAGAVLLTIALAGPIAAFEHLRSPVPVYWLGVAVAVFWYAAVPRGLLQGTQHFTALSANLSLELLTRTSLLFVLLKLGTGVTGSMIAVLAGTALAYAAGMYPLRPILAEHGERVPLRSMAGFAVTAAVGTIGVLLLYNLDVVLAKHYLPDHQAGIYGSLNKVGTILYFLTLSISQVLFPRVVEAVAKNAHAARLLAMSAALMCIAGGCALAVFAALPNVVVNVLFSAQFRDGGPYVFRIGVVGLAISLINLLVQFLMAVHDRLFIPLLAFGVLLMGGLIVLAHDTVGSVVTDVLLSNLVLLALLGVRVSILIPRLRPEMVVENGA